MEEGLVSPGISVFKKSLWPWCENYFCKMLESFGMTRWNIAGGNSLEKVSESFWKLLNFCIKTVAIFFSAAPCVVWIWGTICALLCRTDGQTDRQTIPYGRAKHILIQIQAKPVMWLRYTE